MEVVDRYTLRFRLTATDYNFPYIVAHTSARRRGARSRRGLRRRHMAHPVGTGPVHAEELDARRSKIVLEANPDYRGFIWDFEPSDEPVGPGAGRGDEGQADAAGRPRRDHDHRGGAVDAGSRSSRRSSTTSTSRAAFAPQAFDGDKLKPELSRSRASASTGRSTRRSPTPLQLARPGGRRLRQGKDRAAPRDGHGLRRRARRSTCIRKRQAVRAADAHSGGGRRSRPEVPQHQPVRSRSWPTSCSTISATRRGRRLAHAARRQAPGRSIRQRNRRASTASSTSCGSKSLERDRHPDGF